MNTMFKKLISIIDYLIAPAFYLFAALLILLEYFNGTNFVRSTFHLDYLDVYALSVALIAVIILKKMSKKFLLAHWKKLVFFLPVVAFFGVLIISMRYNSLFVFLQDEDSVIEWLQFFVISASSILSFLLFQKYKAKNKLLSAIFLIAALGFFVVAGEEISWGQRIFGFETPEEYAKMNTQQELTLHNYGPVFGKVYMVYMYFGLVASTLWIVKSYLIKFSHKILKPVFRVLIPGWQYFIYFFTAFAHNYDRFFIHLKVNDVLWEEPMELLLFSGIAIFLFELYMKQLRIFKKR